MQDHIAERKRYFDLEKERQAVANAPRFDREKFLSLYGEQVPELYPYEQVRCEFYHKPPYSNEGNGDPPKNKWRIETALDMAGPDRPARLLDAGCGWPGAFLHAARKRLPQMALVGVDMFSASQYKGPSQYAYVQGSVADMRFVFEDARFDIVVCMETLEHIPPTKTLKVLAEFNRVLKPGGTLVVTVPYTENLIDFSMHCPICRKWVTESGHVRCYPPSVIVSELEVSGFRRVEGRAMPGDGTVRAYKAVKA